MFKGNQVDFQGQTIFVGLDVHKTNWKVNVVVGGQEAAAFSQNPDAEQLVKSLKERFKNAAISVVYEAGFCGFGAYRELLALGVACIVINPADVPTSDKDRKTKTDKRDARKLAKELSKGTLEGIFVPDCEMESVRSLTRYRSHLVQSQTGSINRLKHYLMCYNIKIDEKVTRLTRGVKDKIRKLRTGMAARDFALEMLLTEYEFCRSMVLKVTLELKRLSQQEESLQNIQLLLQSIDGIAVINGMKIQSELVDIKRFKSKDELCSYAGLVPDIYSSNDKSAKRGMTKRCNKHLKSCLIEASWTAIRKDPALLSLYRKYSSKMNANKAIIRIAKHLLMRIRAVWLSGKPYQRGLLSPQKELDMAA